MYHPNRVPSGYGWGLLRFNMNSDVIKLLPDSVANQIAAGEVIQRPASVIKELVENSIDAGATSIQIVLKDAGRTLIQVVDNGCGMSPTDARMAFERHATSKIDTADDLYSLHTMGFRGEALPSIAAVAQVELRTMRKDETIGCRLKISESKFEGSEPATCVVGTNIMVKNLFFHMPARRKYLRKDSVELSHILREFERLALVNTNVDFTITHNDAILHQLIHGSLKQRITGLFGKTIGAQIVPLGTETSMVKISGFIGLPHNAKRRGYQQFFFVNGRNMRHPYFHKAVMSCYSDLIAPDVQPSYFINFEVDPSTIDVNIHPQKHEIKFENEQPIWQILTAAIKQALGKVNAAGAIDFDSTDVIPDIPVFLPDDNTTMPEILTDPHYNPFDVGSEVKTKTASTGIESSKLNNNGYRNARSSPLTRDWEKLYESFASKRNEALGQQPSGLNDDAGCLAPEISEAPTQEKSPELFIEPDSPTRHFTVDNRYIFIPAREGVMIINRHRAHVRVLYDDFIRRMSDAPLPSQRLIFPETLTLSPSQSSIMSSITSMTGRLGYDVSFLGDNVWSINAVPSLPGAINPVDTLHRIIVDIEDSGEIPETALLQPAAISLARSAAITPTGEMNEHETELLVKRLLSSSEPGYTPDGLKIIHSLSFHEISQMFN